MPKCTKCDELFSADEGEYNEDKEFVCATCVDSDGGDKEKDEDDDDLDAEVKACPSCKEKSEDYAESGICPECGHENE